MAEARKSARVSSSTNGCGDRRQDEGSRQSDKRGETTEGEGHLAPEQGAWPGASPPGRPRAGEEGAHLTWRLRAEKQKRTSRSKRRGKQESKPERRQTQSTETAQKGGRPRRGRASQKRSACKAQPGGKEAAGKQRLTARREAEGERRQPRQRGRVKERRRPGEEKSRRGERASRQAKDGQRHQFPCGAAHWKKSEARACRPPRAGRSDREE